MKEKETFTLQSSDALAQASTLLQILITGMTIDKEMIGVVFNDGVDRWNILRKIHMNYDDKKKLTLGGEG